MKSELTIRHADREIDFTLVVSYDLVPKTRGDRITPGEAARVEIASVLCTGMVVWCGDHATEHDPIGKHASIGQYCWDEMREDIEERLLEAAEA